MSEEFQKVSSNKSLKKFAKASQATSREKTEYFHYGLCEIVNHPNMQGLRDLWAGFRGDQLIIKHRKVEQSPPGGKITPPYIIDHIQRQIIFRGLDNNYIIARRDEKQQEYITVDTLHPVSEIN